MLTCGCTGNVTVNGAESGIVEPSSNSGLTYCVHFCINSIGKCISQSLLNHRLESAAFGWKPANDKENNEFQTAENLTRNDSINSSTKV